jgi:hypothetical protein
MQIKDWLTYIAAIGDDDTYIGDSRYHNGAIYYDLTLVKEDGIDGMYPLHSSEGN